MNFKLDKPVAIFLLTFTFFSYAQQPTYQITAFEEDLSQNVQVSGTIMASFLVSGTLKHASPNELYIYVVPEKKQLNVSVVSIDGKYSADMGLTHSVNSPDWIKVEFPSKFKADLEGYAHNELVAYVFADSKDKFGDYIQEVFPTSWGLPKENQRQFLINSSGFSPEYSYKNDTGEVISSVCQKITNKLTRAFNYSCLYDGRSNNQPTLIIINTSPAASGKKFLVWGGI